MRLDLRKIFIKNKLHNWQHSKFRKGENKTKTSFEFNLDTLFQFWDKISSEQNKKPKLKIVKNSDEQKEKEQAQDTEEKFSSVAEMLAKKRGKNFYIMKILKFLLLLIQI